MTERGKRHGGRWPLVLACPGMAITRMRDGNHTMKSIKVSWRRLSICLIEVMFQYSFKIKTLYYISLIQTYHSKTMSIFASD